jgi:MSHA biogenesis protein MshI
MAVCAFRDRLDLAHVCRAGDGKPQVRLLASYAGGAGQADALARLRSTHHLSRFRCVTLLGPGEYQLLQAEAPAVPAAELKTALRWRIKDQLDYPIEAATVDALLIPGDGAGGGRTPQAFAVAAPKATIGARVKPFQDGRIPLQAIDIPELAQRNVAALLEDENRGLALLAFDGSGGLLTITYLGELYAFRRMEISATQLASADEERRAQLVDRIALELQRSFDHFDRQYSFVSLKRLVVAEVPGAPWLAPQLSQHSYLPVGTMDLAAVMDLDAVPELRQPARQGECLQLLGVALRPEALGQ